MGSSAIGEENRFAQAHFLTGADASRACRDRAAARPALRPAA
jgi:hypothetical protein